MTRPTFTLVLLLFTAITSASEDTPLHTQFRTTIQPFIQTYCANCHGATKPKVDLDLTAYTTVDSITKDFTQWEAVVEKIEAAEMPPAKEKIQPKPEQRREVIEWIRALRKYEAQRTAGDPGPVFARRLSNAEYEYTIRDLTGVDIRPAREFPVDPANQAGFDNSSESLTMSPGLVKKYLEAARLVAEHVVFKPDGLAFAPHAVVSDTDRDKYCVNNIMALYKKQPTDLADYFLACRRTELPLRSSLNAQYLSKLTTTLTATKSDSGPLAVLQSMFKAIPANDDLKARDACERMRNFVTELRAKLIPKVDNLSVRQINPSAQCLVLWKDREMAANRTKPDENMLKLFASGETIELENAIKYADILRPPLDTPEKRPAYEKSFRDFCALFPDHFLVTERARVFMDPAKEIANNNVGRLLNAGFHSMMGYFRDDGPMYTMLLDDAQRNELDRLWLELDFIADVPVRQYSGFLWFERTDSSFLRGAEFDFARAEDKDCGNQQKIDKLSKMYIDKARDHGANNVALQAMADYFNEMSTRIRRVENLRREAEPKHLAAAIDFAERAYRRPLSLAERDDLASFYKTLREKDTLTHEDAIRDLFTSILMSPNFLYLSLAADRPAGFQPAPGTAGILPASGAAGFQPASVPLSPQSLASRLSYFLWSSLPDPELLAANLHDPAVLLTQTRRMLKDDRARRLAVEFCGNWLDFRRFEEHNSVNENRFPKFNNNLRAAMFEEPIRFFTDIAKRDASVLDFLYADYTFVNPVLAKHYGMSIPDIGPNDWARVDAAKYGRGGLLPMSVFLTKNSPGLRTSPVKRGYWVVRRVLGERIPPPPPRVPELPSDESKLDLPLRQLLAHHRADKSCAGCHERFDAMGLVFEGYGPIGERRTLDLGNKTRRHTRNFSEQADSGKNRKGRRGERGRGEVERSGLSGLRDYIKEQRESDFLDTLCREMLAYGLGRTLMLSDDPTITDMRQKLEANQFRFGVLIESIVTCPQFLNRRK